MKAGKNKFIIIFFLMFSFYQFANILEWFQFEMFFTEIGD